MERFLASLSNELFKLRKRKKYLVFLIIGAVICVASALRVLIVNYITDGGVSREAILGGLMSSNLPFILLIFLPLMAVMAASDLFVGEQVDHTLRFSLMRPVGKGKLFFSKAAAVFLLCAFDLAVLYVVSTVAQVGLGGGTEGILTSLGACLLDLIPLAVLLSSRFGLDGALYAVPIADVLVFLLSVGLVLGEFRSWRKQGWL